MPENFVVHRITIATTCSQFSHFLRKRLFFVRFFFPLQCRKISLFWIATSIRFTLIVMDIEMSTMQYGSDVMRYEITLHYFSLSWKHSLSFCGRCRIPNYVFSLKCCRTISLVVLFNARVLYFFLKIFATDEALSNLLSMLSICSSSLLFVSFCGISALFCVVFRWFS